MWQYVIKREPGKALIPEEEYKHLDKNLKNLASDFCILLAKEELKDMKKDI